MIPPRYLKVVTCSSSASSITSLDWTGSSAVVKVFVLEVETAMLCVFAVVQNLFSNSCSLSSESAISNALGLYTKEILSAR